MKEDQVLVDSRPAPFVAGDRKSFMAAATAVWDTVYRRVSQGHAVEETLVIVDSYGRMTHIRSQGPFVDTPGRWQAVVEAHGGPGVVYVQTGLMPTKRATPGQSPWHLLAVTLWAPVLDIRHVRVQPFRTEGEKVFLRPAEQRHGDRAPAWVRSLR